MRFVAFAVVVGCFVQQGCAGEFDEAIGVALFEGAGWFDAVGWVGVGLEGGGHDDGGGGVDFELAFAAAEEAVLDDEGSSVVGVFDVFGGC